MTLFGYVLIGLVVLGFCIYGFSFRKRSNNYVHGYPLPDQPSEFGGVDEYDLYG